MTIDFTQKLYGLDGTVLKDGENEVSLAIIVSNSLLAALPSDSNMSAKSKVDLFRLAQKINLNPASVELTSEEVSLVKDRVGASYAPLVVGLVWSILDPNSVK